MQPRETLAWPPTAVTSTAGCPEDVMEPSPATVFRFTAEGVDLEFAGTEEFVEKQVQRFRKFLEDAAGVPAPEAPAAPEAPSVAPANRESLDTFYAARPLREGRGAIQDRILLFI